MNQANSAIPVMSNQKKLAQNKVNASTKDMHLY